MPRWITLGAAHYQQTPEQLAEQRGALRMLALSEFPHVQDLAVNQALPREGDAALIGSAFMHFLVATYGRDAMLQWLAAINDQWLPGFYFTAYQNTFGISLSDDWQNFETWVKARAKLELDAITNIELVDGSIQAKGRVSLPVLGPEQSVWYKLDRLEQPDVLKNSATGESITLPSRVFDIQYRNGQWQALRYVQCANGVGSEWVRYERGAWWLNDSCEGVVQLVPGSDNLVIRQIGDQLQLNRAGLVFRNVPLSEAPIMAAADGERVAVLGVSGEIYLQSGDAWQPLNTRHLSPSYIVLHDEDVFFISSESQVNNIWRAGDMRPVTNVVGGVQAFVMTGYQLWLLQQHPEGLALSRLDNPVSAITGALPDSMVQPAKQPLFNLNTSPYATNLTLIAPIAGGSIAQPAVGSGVYFAGYNKQQSAELEGLAEAGAYQITANYTWPSWQLAARYGQLSTSLLAPSDWAGGVRYQKPFNAGLNVMHTWQSTVQYSSREFRLGVGYNIDHRHFATYGLLPLRGGKLASTMSWGVNNGLRFGGQYDWYRQFGRLYSRLGVAAIVDSSEQAMLADNLFASAYTGHLDQVKLNHPGVSELGSATTLWQQKSSGYWASEYRPRGLAFWPAGINRAGLSLQSLTSGTITANGQSNIALSIGAGVLADWRLANVPVRTELIGYYGLLNAAPSVAIELSYSEF
ncbi:hypothetical protein [Salinibius halmophilus]|uniref:hypothetical protein n=1 Tax=Salinibius halmophilus TaxID=1853216 RepID=UPI0013145A97|nr:hypothetical protein [Salinibius halmophilus]